MRPKASDVLFYLGQHSDSPSLDSQGRKDAQDMSNFFGRVKLGGIVTSDVHSSLETGLAVGEHRDITPTVEPALRDPQHARPFFAKAIHVGSKSKKPHLLIVHPSVIKEASAIFNGDPDKARVHPGGALAVIHSLKGLHVVPIFKPVS